MHIIEQKKADYYLLNFKLVTKRQYLICCAFFCERKKNILTVDSLREATTKIDLAYLNNMQKKSDNFCLNRNLNRKTFYLQIAPCLFSLL